MNRRRIFPKMILGWREWVAMPELGLPAIKAKLDTGAQTSSLHAFDIEPFSRDGVMWVRFCVHPLPEIQDLTVICEAKLVDRRKVTSSMGGRQKRFVIATTLHVAERSWPVEVTLTNRLGMRYHMLLGRSTMAGKIVVDPQISFQTGQIDTSTAYAVQGNAK